MKKGFTLVELAIVLVIIGLLVGGVLQGQELIKQAQIRSHIKSVNEIRLAAATFQSKYDALPGDIKQPERFFPECNNAIYDDGSAVYRGDGDGLIGNDEIICVWLHLYNSGIYQAEGFRENEVMVGFPPQDINFETDSLGSAKWDGDRRMYVEVRYTYAHSLSFSPRVQKNTIIVRGVGYGFSPADIYSIDAKMDDGRPGLGVIRAVTARSSDEISLLGDCYTDYLGAYGDEENHPTASSEYIIDEEVRSCWAGFAL